MNKTDHQSFIIKPSTIEGGGVGVFALHDIAEGVTLELFSSDFQEELRDKDSVPAELQGYCLDQEDGKLLCPKAFNNMPIGNYLNHSKADSNIKYLGNEQYAAKRAIQAGEELLADYNELEEPEETREVYYQN